MKTGRRLQPVQTIPFTSVWLVVLISVAAVALRTGALGRNELWFDEAYSALLALESPRRIVSELSVDSSPPLYFLLLHLWSRVFGVGAVALRWCSVAAGVMAVPVVASLATRLWGPSTPIYAMVLLAVSPLHVYYSREVRPYALLVLLCLLSLLCLEKLIQTGRTRDGVLYGATTLAACYTHNYGLLLVVPATVNILNGRLPLKRGGLWLGLVAVGYAAWLPLLLGQVASGASQWIAPLWRSTPPSLALVKTFATFCFGGMAPPYLLLGQEPLSGLLPSVSYLVFSAIVVRALAGRFSDHARRIAVSLVVMLAIPFSVSFVTPVYLVGRHDLIALPLFLLLCARGIERFRLPLRVSSLIVVLGLATISLLAYYGRAPERQTIAQADALRAAADGDLILCTGFTRNALEYQVRIAGGEQRFLSFPRSSGEHRGWVDERALADPSYVRSDAIALMESLDRAMNSDDRLWIAHARELAGANDVLMREVEQRFQQIPCAANGEARGFTCWRKRSGGGPRS